MQGRLQVIKMRKLGWLTALVALALAGCGGGDGSDFAGNGSSGGSSGGASNVTSVSVSASAASIPADGSASVTVTALVRDANNVALSGQTVTFSASAGSLVVTQATSDSSGNATATISAGGAASGTQITVTATVGSVSGTTTINVVASQQTVTLIASSPQLPSNGSKPVTVQAIVRNASNQLVSGVAVQFTTTSGGITPVVTAAGAAANPAVPAGITDANGTAAAQLVPLDPTNRTITVTASMGSTSAAVNVSVVGTTVTVTGPSSVILGGSASYAVAVLDSGNAGISGVTVGVSSAHGNTLSATSLVTDSTGHATFTVTAAQAGNDTITATALGLSATQALSVSSQSVQFTQPLADATVDINASQPVTLVWTNNGAPQTGQSVSFSTTRGTFGNCSGSVTTSVTTDGTGTATTAICSKTAGPAVITATAGTVTRQVAINFVATAPTQMSLQASPSTVQPQGQSTITAVLRDVSGNLVANQTVSFQLSDVTGGSLSAGSAVTNLQGQAQVVYTASSAQSASNGVQITATVQNFPAVTGTVTLTVGGQAVFLSLGTGATISENQAKTQFLLPYIVQASDAAGNPVANVTITLTLHSNPPFAPDSNVALTPTGVNFTAPAAAYAAYWKGQWVYNGTKWIWSPADPLGCLNEDVNGTGIFSSSEDLNGNGRLDPGDVASVSPGTIVTDSSGSANITIAYPESYAAWVQVKLVATATVSGTQSSTYTVFQLPMLADYVSRPGDPPGKISPFGVGVDPSCKIPN